MADEKASYETNAVKIVPSNSVRVADNDASAQSSPKFLLKLDFRIVPILGLCYMILFLDRTNSKSYFKAKLPHSK